MLLNPLWCAVLLSVLHLSPRENEVVYDVVAIVDPLTREAQKMSPLLIVSCILLHQFPIQSTETQSLPKCTHDTIIRFFKGIIL